MKNRPLAFFSKLPSELSDRDLSRVDEYDNRGALKVSVADKLKGRPLKPQLSFTTRGKDGATTIPQLESVTKSPSVS